MLRVWFCKSHSQTNPLYDASPFMRNKWIIYSLTKTVGRELKLPSIAILRISERKKMMFWETFLRFGGREKAAENVPWTKDIFKGQPKNFSLVFDFSSGCHDIIKHRKKNYLFLKGEKFHLYS